MQLYRDTRSMYMRVCDHIKARTFAMASHRIASIWPHFILLCSRLPSLHRASSQITSRSQWMVSCNSCHAMQASKAPKRCNLILLLNYNLMMYQLLCVCETKVYIHWMESDVMCCVFTWKQDVIWFLKPYRRFTWLVYVCDIGQWGKSSWWL